MESYGNLGNDHADGYSSVRVQAPQVDSVLILSNERALDKATASYSLNYRFKNTKGRTLTFLADYTQVKNSPLNYYDYSGSGPNYVRKQQITDNDYHIFSSQLDYVHPLTATFKFSGGAKYSLLKSTIEEVLNDWMNTSKCKF